MSRRRPPTYREVASNNVLSYEERSRVTIGCLPSLDKTKELSKTESRLQTLEERTMIHADSLSRLWKSHMAMEALVKTVDVDEEGDVATPSFDQAYDKMHGFENIGMSLEDRLRRDASKPWFMTYELKDQTGFFPPSVKGVKTDVSVGSIRLEINLRGLYKKANRIRYGKWIAQRLAETLEIPETGNETWNPIYTTDMYMCTSAANSFYQIALVTKRPPGGGDEVYIRLAESDRMVKDIISAEFEEVIDLTSLTKDKKKTNEFVVTKDTSQTSGTVSWYAFNRAHKDALQDATLVDRLRNAARRLTKDDM